MKKFAKGAIAASLLAVSSASMAGDLYGIFMLQQSAIDVSVDGDSTVVSAIENTAGAALGYPAIAQGDFTFDDESILSASVGVGYMFTENFGLELAYNDYALDDETEGYENLLSVIPDINNPGEVLNIMTPVEMEMDSVQSISLAGIAQTSAGENFAIFGKLGVEAWEAELSGTSVAGVPVMGSDDTDDGYDFFVGFGFKLDLSERITLVHDYTWHKFNGNEVDVDIRTIGLGLHVSF